MSRRSKRKNFSKDRRRVRHREKMIDVTRESMMGVVHRRGYGRAITK